MISLPASMTKALREFFHLLGSTAVKAEPGFGLLGNRMPWRRNEAFHGVAAPCALEARHPNFGRSCLDG